MTRDESDGNSEGERGDDSPLGEFGLGILRGDAADDFSADGASGDQSVAAAGTEDGAENADDEESFYACGEGGFSE